MFDRRLLENFDWIFLGFVLAISLLGILNLYSASQEFQTGGLSICAKQINWLLMGLVIMCGILVIDYHRVGNAAFILYGLGLVLLVLVLLIGRKVSGAQRWLDLGVFPLQPSEIMKIFAVIALARYFSQREYPDGLGFKELIGPGLIVGVPFLLILKQPDLGTALHLTFTCLAVLAFLRVRRYVLLTLTACITAAIPTILKRLEAYQLERIVTFLNPERDPLGAGYHIIQSKIAVGSGQFWGKGFMKGTQTQLSFLPEQHTDFAFSVLAEEWGFFGSIVLLLLYLGLILVGLRIVAKSQDRFGALLALGLVSLIFWQVLINICMVTGLMPVVGIPLPFISYGGSSLVTTFMAIGLILNVGMRRFLFQDQRGNFRDITVNNRK